MLFRSLCASDMLIYIPLLDVGILMCMTAGIGISTEIYPVQQKKWVHKRRYMFCILVPVERYTIGVFQEIHEPLLIYVCILP